MDYNDLYYDNELASENEDDEDISLEEDVLEKAAKSKTPSRTKAARVLENSNFDFE